MVQVEEVGELLSGLQKDLEREMTATPSKYPQKYFREKSCRCCGEEFSPVGPSHFYCTPACKKNAKAGNRYLKLYGVSPRDVVDKFNEQGGLCAICGGEGFKMNEGVRHGLNLDHCHATGKVRGWLCHNCNRALGLLQDSPELMRRAAEYVELYRDDSTA